MPVDKERALIILSEEFDTEEEVRGFIQLSRPAIKRVQLESKLKQTIAGQDAELSGIDEQMQALTAEYNRQAGELGLAREKIRGKWEPVINAVYGELGALQQLVDQATQTIISSGNK